MISWGAALVGIWLISAEAAQSKPRACLQDLLASVTQSAQRSSLKRVSEISAQGLTSPAIIAVHGTSLEALAAFLKTGKWPPSKVSGFKTQMFVYGLKERTSAFKGVPGLSASFDREEHFLPMSTAVDICAHYADTVAKEHGFLSELGVPITPRNAEYASQAVEPYLFDDVERQSGPSPAAYFKKTYGILPADFKRATLAAQKRKGIVIGLDSRVLKHTEVSVVPAQDTTFDEGLVFDTRKLLIEDIAGIQPLGPVEKKWLEGLGQ